jgi:2-dehydropantoate 2-reductase
MNLRRFCVFGAGAIGGNLAARLAAAGHDVSVIARGAHLAAIQARGITLHMDAKGVDADAKGVDADAEAAQAGRTIAGRVRASDRAADVGVQDVVLVTMKATGLPALAEAAPLLSGPATMFVFVQNGIPWWYAQGLSSSRPRPPDLSALDPGARLAKAVSPERVIGGVVYSSNDLVAPGEVHNHAPARNMLVLGEPDDAASERVAALRAVLNAAGMHSPVATDIRQSIWDKLLVNFGSTLCVPLGEPILALTEDPELRALRAQVVAEGKAIAAAHGVSTDGAPRRPGLVAGATLHKPSMLQDFELGRPMEVESILRTPLAFARAARVPAPLLEMLTALTTRLARGKGLYSS